MNTIEIHVDGEPLRVSGETTVAVALLSHDRPHFRRSVRGEPRGPLCAMGTCFECRVTIDGVPGRRACLVSCQDGMVVSTRE